MKKKKSGVETLVIVVNCLKVFNKLVQHIVYPLLYQVCHAHGAKLMFDIKTFAGDFKLLYP